MNNEHSSQLPANAHGTRSTTELSVTSTIKSRFVPSLWWRYCRNFTEAIQGIFQTAWFQFDHKIIKVDIPILRFEKTLINTFLVFVIHRNSFNNPIGNDWINITKEEFDNFIIDPTYLARRRSLTNAHTAKTTPTLPKPRFASKQTALTIGGCQGGK
jgi:hypothetical protein